MDNLPFPSISNFQEEPLPQDEAEVRRRHEANRQGWNQGAMSYRSELDETLAFLKAGKSNLHPIERQNLGNLRDWCHSAIHLQCASGRDTLSLWNEGVPEVIGVDISDVHIENARWLTEQLGAPARWYRCDILDTPAELDGVADLVYTGRGALCWIHDLRAWGHVVARLLKPGGVVHILDDHPATWLFDVDADTLTPSGVNYFAYSESGRGWPSTYIGDLGMDILEHSLKYERLWPLSAVFTALHEAGLNVELFGEYSEPYWDVFDKLPDQVRRKLPLTFAMMARK